MRCVVKKKQLKHQASRNKSSESTSDSSVSLARSVTCCLPSSEQTLCSRNLINVTRPLTHHRNQFWVGTQLVAARAGHPSRRPVMKERKSNGGIDRPPWRDYWQASISRRIAHAAAAHLHTPSPSIEPVAAGPI